MTVETSHRATLENGPSVVDGQLVWTSATGITSADHNSFGGCLRRFYYEQVEGRKGPPTAAMKAGTTLHSEIEDHLRTGASLTSPLALAGRMFVPTPGSNLLIEKPIKFATRAGVQIYGHVDLYNTRQQYIDEEGALHQDPPWSFEVKDWKTTSDFQYAKSAQMLAENIQLVTYAEAGFRLWPDLEHARLTHVYFRTRGTPASKLVTIRRSREEIEARWEYAESVVRVMVDVAKEQSAESVPANTASCSAYRGCPHAGYCTAYRRTSLDALYGKIAQDFKETNVGLLSNNPQIMNQQPTQAAPAQPDMRAQLAAEEQQMRAQVAQQQQQMPQTAASLAEICQRLGSYGFGFPALGGNAAMAYAQLGGQNVPAGFVYQGILAPPGAGRSLHQVQLNEVAHIIQLEGELAAERARQMPQLPPQQNPVQQFVPTQQPPPAQQYVPTPPGPSGVASFLPPNAPESMPQLAQAHEPTQPYVPGSEPSATPIPQPEKKPGRGRPKKSQDAAPEAAAAVAAQVPPPSAGAPATQAPPAAGSASPPGLMSNAALAVDAAVCSESGCILINARFANKPTKSLAGYVDYINEKLAKMYNTTNDGRPGPLDVRAAVEGSSLGYGGWKGSVRTAVQAEPPPNDNYHLDTFASELNEIVADALRAVAERRGWLYVRGVRA